MPRIAGAIRDVDLGYRALLRSIEKMDREVLVGIRGEEGAQRPERQIELADGSSATIQSDATIAEYATYNEFGTDDGHIPERSFLRSTVDERRESYLQALGEAMLQTIDKGIDIEQPLALLGERAVRDVQRKIREITDPPNAPSTIAQKGSSKPLIDNGTMRQAISFEVRPARKA